MTNPLNSHGTIVADPPWEIPWNARFGGGRNGDYGLPYDTMTLEQIAGLPVSSFAAEQSHLWLWATNGSVWNAHSVAVAWGFTYRYLLTWAKPLGMGARFRMSSEFVLFCDRGEPLPVLRHDVSTWHRWPRREHSSKPEAFYDLVETVSPGPYLEMFARRQRLGWDTWGNEALEHVALSH